MVDIPRLGEVRLVESLGGIAPTPAPGTTITSPADTSVGVGVTENGPVIPAGATRMRVQVTGGDATTRIRVREMGGTAGTGILLTLLASTVYGAAEGAIERLEFQNVVGPVAAVAVQFEGP